MATHPRTANQLTGTGCAGHVTDVQGVGSVGAFAKLAALFGAVGGGSFWAGWQFGAAAPSRVEQELYLAQLENQLAAEQRALDAGSPEQREGFPGPPDRHAVAAGNVTDNFTLTGAALAAEMGVGSHPVVPGTNIRAPGTWTEYLTAVATDIELQQEYVNKCFEWLATPWQPSANQRLNPYHAQWAVTYTANAVANLQALAEWATGVAQRRMDQLDQVMPGLLADAESIQHAPERAQAYQALVATVQAETLALGKMLGKADAAARSGFGMLSALSAIGAVNNNIRLASTLAIQGLIESLQPKEEWYESLAAAARAIAEGAGKALAALPWLVGLVAIVAVSQRSGRTR